MSSPLKPKDKKLQAEWYQKLMDEDFHDIEDTERPDRPLKAWHSLRFRNNHASRVAIVQEYYYRAKELLLTYSFESDTHKHIWKLHCDGLSKRQIEKILNKKKFKRESIGSIIQLIASTIK